MLATQNSACCLSLRAFFTHFCLVLLALPCSAQVIVDWVAKDSPAQKAGLQPGDIIKSWASSTGGGTILSPFDFDEVLSEYYPRGPVEFRGIRQTRELSWVFVGVAQVDYAGISVRPFLSTSLLASYQESEKLAEAGKALEAATLFRSALKQVAKSDPPWMSCWILGEVANYSGRAGDFGSQEAAFSEAVELSRSTAPILTALLLDRWAHTLAVFRGPAVTKATRLKQALEARRKDMSESLAVAQLLVELGSLVFQDPPTAEPYFLEALAIQNKLAPESWATAQTLKFLGQTAIQQSPFVILRGSLGNHYDSLARAKIYYQQAVAVFERVVPGSEWDSLAALGEIAIWEGDLKRAEEYYKRSLELRIVLGNISGELYAEYQRDQTNRLEALAGIEGNAR